MIREGLPPFLFKNCVLFYPLVLLCPLVVWFVASRDRSDGVGDMEHKACAKYTL